MNSGAKRNVPNSVLQLGIVEPQSAGAANLQAKHGNAWVMPGMKNIVYDVVYAISIAS